MVNVYVTLLEILQETTVIGILEWLHEMQHSSLDDVFFEDDVDAM